MGEEQPSGLKLSLVIPCFNESENVGIVMDTLQGMVSEVDVDIEVIMVDGASTDDTPDYLRQRFKSLDSSQFKLVLQSTRGGYGYDIMAGLNVATGDVLAWTHADLQTDLYDVIQAYRRYCSSEGQAVLVKGKRRNRPLLDVFLTFGMQLFSWVVLHVYLSDINAQPKLFSRSFYLQYLKGLAPSDFSLDLFLLYQAYQHQYSILTIPVYFSKRIYGEAKGGGGSWKNKWGLIRRTVRYIFKLKATV